MIEFEKIALKNIVVHKNSSFEFKDGISVVRGTNGAGKSLIFNSLANLFFSAPPLLKKKDAKILHDEDSAIGAKYKFSDKEYRVVQECKKSSLNYKIEENGVNLEPRTISIAKDILERSFPISESHYYSLIHLTSYRPFILLSGTGPQRKEFFEELFHLNVSEYVGEKIKEQYNELKRERDEANILSEQLKDLTYIEDLESLRKECAEKDSEYRKLELKYNEYMKNISLITSYETYRGQLLHPEISLSEIEAKISKVEEGIKKFETLYNNLNLNIKLYEQNEDNREKLKRLKESLEGFSEIMESSEDIKSKYNELKLKGEELVRKIREAESTNKLCEEFENLSKYVSKEAKEMSYEEYLKKTSVAESQIREKESIIEKLNTLQNESTCPMCQQPLSEDNINSLIASLNNDILYIGMVLCNKTETIKWFKLKEENLVRVDKEALDTELNDIKGQLIELKELHSRAKEKERIEREIEAFPKIVNFDSEPDSSLLVEYQAKIEKGRNALERLKSDQRIHKELNKLDLSKIEKVDKNGLQKEIEEIQPRISELNEERMRLNANLKIGTDQNARYKKIEERIKEIKEKLVKIPIYEALIKAYSAKGIRIAQIAYLAEMFCNNLNKYANMVFNKKMTFHVNVDANNFNILASRNNRTSDVSQLSGQESRFFMLLCALSLLPFIPEKLRCDTIILDEIEAGVSEENRKYLVNQGFFEALKKVVKKIVIVTPMSGAEYYIEANQEYFISLKEGVSCIEKVK